MPRPRQTIIRDHQLNLSLTLAEYETLVRRADAAGVRPGAYARAVLLGSALRIEQGATTTKADRLVLHHWQRCGANLNQLTRRFHGLGQIAPDELGAVLADLRRLIDEAAR